MQNEKLDAIIILSVEMLVKIIIASAVIALVKNTPELLLPVLGIITIVIVEDSVCLYRILTFKGE